MGITYSASPYSEPVITLDVVGKPQTLIAQKTPVVRFEDGVYHLADGSQVDCCEGCGVFPVVELKTMTTDPVWPGEPPREVVGNYCGRCR